MASIVNKKNLLLSKAARITATNLPWTISQISGGFLLLNIGESDGLTFAQLQLAMYDNLFTNQIFAIHWHKIVQTCCSHHLKCIYTIKFL